MAEPVPLLIRIAALSALLIDALDEAREDPEAKQLATERFAADLRALHARAVAELETLSGGRRLRVADEADDSVVADD
jgi:hypothetical protein